MERDLRYEVSQLLSLVGINSPVYFPERINQDKTIDPKYLEVKTLSDSAQATGVSQFGTPIWNPTTLKGLNYKVFDTGTGELKYQKMEDWKIPPTSLIDFQHEHNVVKTEVSGSQGTVKEFFGFSDFAINIRGFLLDDRIGGTTALEKKTQLLQWNKIAEAITIEGVLFSDKEIYQIVIENITIKQVEGSPNVFEFQIDAVSDSPFAYSWL